MRTSIPFLALLVAPCAAFVAPSVSSVVTQGGRFGSATQQLKATAADAIASLDASQAATMSKIASSIPVQSRPDLSVSAQDGVTVAGCPVTVDGREAPGSDGNVAWLANVCAQSKMSSLTIFNGPLTNVPHLLSRCCVVNDNTLSFTLDFRILTRTLSAVVKGTGC